jgi:preprotein translocase subunit YajC
MIGTAWAQTGGGAAAPSMWLNIAPFILIFGIFYFLIIRPQIKRQRTHEALIKNLSKGDEVVTQGGLCGTIVGTKDDVVVLKIAENTKIEMLRSAVTGLRGKSDRG